MKTKQPVLLFDDFNLPYLIKKSNIATGGATVRQYALLQGLTKLDIKIGVLTWKGANDLIKNKVLGYDLVETYNQNFGIRKLRWLYYRFPLLFLAVYKYKPDFIIHKCLAGIINATLLVICKLLKKPYIYMAANDVDSDGRYKERLNTFDQKLFKFSLKYATAIFCQNTYQYENFKSHFPNKPMFIVKNPYFAFDQNYVVKRNNSRTYIAWVGIFQHQKNLTQLFRIAQKNPEINFKIAGKRAGNIDSESIMALKELEKLNNIEFVGFLNPQQIMPFLNDALALLNTSHYEGYSNTFLEALYVGTPIISTKVNPNNIFSDYRIGFLVDEKNISSIFASLQSSFDFEDFKNTAKDYMDQNHNHINIALKFVKSLLSIPTSSY